MFLFNDGRMYENQNWLKGWLRSYQLAGCGSDHDRIFSEGQQTTERKNRPVYKGKYTGKIPFKKGNLKSKEIMIYAI